MLWQRRPNVSHRHSHLCNEWMTKCFFYIKGKNKKTILEMKMQVRTRNSKGKWERRALKCCSLVEWDFRINCSWRSSHHSKSTPANHNSNSTTNDSNLTTIHFPFISWQDYSYRKRRPVKFPTIPIEDFSSGATMIVTDDWLFICTSTIGFVPNSVWAPVKRMSSMHKYSQTQSHTPTTHAQALITASSWQNHLRSGSAVTFWPKLKS